MKKIVSVFGKRSKEYDELNDRALSYAKKLGMEYEWVPMEEYTQEKAVDALKNGDAGIIDVEKYDAEIFEQICDKTKLLVRFGVGFDAVNLKDATASNILVGRTKGANASGVAEHAMTLMLALKRKIVQHHNSMVKGEWDRDMGNELYENTIGIVGFGAVGATLAKYLKGFDCRVLVYDPYLNQDVADELGVEATDMATLFKESDQISLHLPLSPATEKIVNADLIKTMKPSAILVNTSRGGVIDEEALISALKNNVIAGAGLDVFVNEPLENESKLRELSNVILTPHIASNTMDSLWNIYKTAIDIAHSFFEGDVKEWDHCLLNPEVL